MIGLGEIQELEKRFATNAERYTGKPND